MDKHVLNSGSCRKLTSLLISAFVSTMLFASNAAVADVANCTSRNSNETFRSNSPSPALGTVDIEWRVTYTVGAAPWYTTTVTNLQKISGGNTQSAKTDTWFLKWGHRDKSSVTGTFDTVKQPVFGFLAPRLVSPDGACAIYLGYPGTAVFATVAVVGDSLTQNTYYEHYDGAPKTAAEYDSLNVQYPLGRLGQELAARGWAASIEGIGGHRLNITYGIRTLNLLAQANTTLLDEFRGMSKFTLMNRARVVALGANDAFYISGSGFDVQPGSTVESRGFEIFLRSLNFLVEATSNSTCVVLVSPVRSSNNTAFNQASLNMENFYADAVAGVYNGQGVISSRLRLAKFGERSLNKPWFRSDTIHLNDVGATEYAKLIADTVATCPY